MSIIFLGNKKISFTGENSQNIYSLQVIEIEDSLFLNTLDSIFENNKPCRNYIYYLKSATYGKESVFYLSYISVTSLNRLLEETSHFATFIGGRLVVFVFKKNAEFPLRSKKLDCVISFKIKEQNVNLENKITFQRFTYWIIYHNKVITHYSYECLE